MKKITLITFFLITNILFAGIDGVYKNKKNEHEIFQIRNNEVVLIKRLDNGNLLRYKGVIKKDSIFINQIFRLFDFEKLNATDSYSLKLTFQNNLIVLGDNHFNKISKVEAFELLKN